MLIHWESWIDGYTFWKIWFCVSKEKKIREVRKWDLVLERAGGIICHFHVYFQKYRRAHLKECFDILKREVPSLEDKKTSNLNILRSALKHIQVSMIPSFWATSDMERVYRIEWASQCLGSFEFEKPLYWIWTSLGTTNRKVRRNSNCTFFFMFQWLCALSQTI